MLEKNSCSWLRARSEDQIEERLKEILRAAGTIFQKMDYEKVTMQMIASKVSFTRSNLYRYFKVKEEIFLTLFLMDIQKWIKAVKKNFNRKMNIDSFVEKWCSIFLQQKRLLRLSPFLSLALEKNISEDTYKKTKIEMMSKIKELSLVLLEYMPKISEEKLLEFLGFHQAFVAGLLPMTQYTKMQRKVIKELGVSIEGYSFESLYKSAVKNYISGLYKD